MPGCEGPKVSPDFLHVAYSALASPLSPYPDVVVLDGKRLERYESVWALRFSPDSSGLTYKALSKGDTSTQVVLINGSQSGLADDREYMASEPGRPAASKRHQRGKVYVDFDGKSYGPYDEVPDLKVSPDSRRLAYVYTLNGKAHVVFGEQTYGPYDAVEPLCVTVSPDWQRIAFPARFGTQWFMICGPDKHGPHSNAPIGRFSPNAKHLLCFGRMRGEKAPVYFDGARLAEMDLHTHHTFSPDGDHWVVMGRKEGRNVLLIDGVETECSGEGIGAIYSPDSKRLALKIMEDGKYTILVDGRKGKSYKEIYPPWRFSPDSKRLAYFARDESSYVLVIDGVEVWRYHGAGPSQSNWGFVGNDVLRGLVTACKPLVEPSVRSPKTERDFLAVPKKLRLVLFALSAKSAD